jgi:hypothetical protein
MVAKTRQSKAPVTIENVPSKWRGVTKASEYSVDIVPGESITIRCRKTVVRPAGRDVYVNPSLVRALDALAPREWALTLDRRARAELAAMIDDGALAIAADWAEERGGRREWVGLLSTLDRCEPVEEDIVRTFRLGEQAEHGSYNLSYYGTITSITARTVTIDDDGQVKRLSLCDFCRRNWDFDLAKARKRNTEWMD